MATHTLPENINIIRTTGVYGPDIREAIAQAIEQSDDAADARIDQIHQDIVNRDLFMQTTKIAGTSSDYLLVITNPT